MGITNRRGEEGSASIEATISLVIFIVVILAIYMISSFCVVQAKVAYAIDTTAKEMSQYSYFYHALGLEAAYGKLDEGSEMATSTFENLVGVVSGVTEKVNNVSQSSDTLFADVLESGEGDSDSELYSQIQKANESVSAAVSDPRAFMTSLASLAGKNLMGTATNAIAAPMAKGLTKRHFEIAGCDADTYLEGMGVVGGYDGLNFNKSTIFEDGSDKIEVVVYYRLNLKNVIPMLDKEVVISQKAITNAWLGGDAS